MKTVEMIFTEDKYVDGKPFAEANKPVQVNESSVARWEKRGGKVVGKKVEAEDTAATKEAPKSGSNKHDKSK